MNEPNANLLRQYGTLAVFQQKLAGASPFVQRVAGDMLEDGGLATQEAQQLNEQFRMAEQRLHGNDRQLTESKTLSPSVLLQSNSTMPGWADDGTEGITRTASVAREIGRDFAKEAFGSPSSPSIGARAMNAAQGVGNVLKQSVSGFGATKRFVEAGQPPRAAPQAPMGPPPGGPYRTPVGKPKIEDVTRHAVPDNGKPGLMEGALGPNWKAKGLAIGGLAGAGYLGLKGLQSGLDYLSGESHPQNYSAPGGYTLPMGVNQYGVPQLGTPLM